jgi:hypothetical protein
VLMVATDPNDTPQTIENFRQRGNVGSLPWTIDQRGEISRSLGVNALETTLIIDREGEIVFRDTGPTDLETLEGELEEVL